MDLKPSTQPPAPFPSASYFVWEPADKRIAIHLSGDAVDQINHVVMRGFGALPRRGAEVGGLLLGSVSKSGGQPVVRIEKFIPIPCAHLHGPSYILCEDDMPAFDGELTAHAADSGTAPYVLGFVRSHTREPIHLDEADLALLDSRFPGGDAVCLLVKPYATHPCEAVFLVREGGRFSCEAQTEPFLFRRKEMRLPPAARRERPAQPENGLEAGPEGGKAQVQPPETAERPSAEPLASDPSVAGAPAPESGITRINQGRFRRSARPPFGDGYTAGDHPGFGQNRLPASVWEDQRTIAEAPGSAEMQPDMQPRPGGRSRWIWLAVSLALLALGVLLGMAIGSRTKPTQSQTASPDPYDLRLSVSRTEAGYNLRWNRQMPALQEAQKGELLIEEAGAASKTQELSVADLTRGDAVYQGAQAPLRFRLTLFLRDGMAFSGTVETQPGQSGDQTRSGTMTGSERSGNKGRSRKHAVRPAGKN